MDTESPNGNEHHHNLENILFVMINFYAANKWLSSLSTAKHLWYLIGDGLVFFICFVLTIIANGEIDSPFSAAKHAWCLIGDDKYSLTIILLVCILWLIPFACECISSSILWSIAIKVSKENKENPSKWSN